MKNLHPKLAAALSIAGTILVGIPLLAPLILGFVSLLASGRFRVDFLMPAEILPVSLLGGLLLLWYSLAMRRYRKFVIAGLAGMLLFLGGSQLLAILTGLADGSREASGWPLILVLSVYSLFILCQLFLLLLGIKLASQKRT